MPQAPVVTSSRPASYCAAPTFVCTSKTGSSAAWIQAAGELDFAASLQLGRTLREAQLSARLLVLDLRELTFIGSSGVGVILEADRRAQRVGGRLMLVRGPAAVERVLALSGVSGQVLMFDLDPGEPSPALLDAPEKSTKSSARRTHLKLGRRAGAPSVTVRDSAEVPLLPLAR